MTSERDPRETARELADAARAGDAAAWAAGRRTLTGLDGHSWLVLDHAARSLRHIDGASVSGARGWLGESVNEPSGFVAAVTSLHVNGRIRERAVQVLGDVPMDAAGPALAVRLLDHVPQVRARAWAVLRPRVGLDSAEALADVLLAGAGRNGAGEALSTLEAALVAAVPAGVLVAALTVSGRLRVRRWGFELGHRHGLLTTERLVEAAQGDADQRVRAWCAEWLERVPDPGVLVNLLGARSVEARLAAVRRLPESALDDDALTALLVDRSPRVREQARYRARRRGLDPAEVYRRRLAEEHPSPHLAAACLDGLALAGDGRDLDAAATRLRDPSVRVRAAAVGTVVAWATRGRAVELLTPVLLDPGSRVCSAAARGLVRIGAPPSVADAAWVSGLASSRRAAWRLTRAAGAWHRVEADLRVSVDPDPGLHALGRTSIGNWLAVGAATTWQPLLGPQRERIAALLSRPGLDLATRRLVGFHAGVAAPATA